MSSDALSSAAATDPAARPAFPLLRRYRAVRARTQALAAPLTPEDCALQSMPDASPVKWHMAHTSWFFETFILARQRGDYQPFHPQFRILFNSYYNAVGDKHPRPERGLVSRPGLPEVLAYREHVDQQVQALLSAAAGHEVAPEVASLIELGLHHEQQHQELILTDALHLLSRNPLLPAYEQGGEGAAAEPSDLRWIRYRAGVANIGHVGTAFAFDNELPRHRVWLEAFELASRPVTNGEYLEFIEDGGYRRPELWLALGFDTVRDEGWCAPLYWTQQGSRWRVYTLGGAVALDPHASVEHVSYFEADAYARWAGARLPTEFEWEAVAARGRDAAAIDTWSPAARAGGSSLRYGDVWEWTSSAYAAYPGYRTAPGALGEYNGKFMCGQHVLRGGSRATPPGHARITYRNFFPPHARWQFSGLRLARDHAT
jgi:ergothioneine biosynthesis protein EgtB